MRRVEVDDALSTIPANGLVEICQDARNADSANDQYIPASAFAVAANVVAAGAGFTDGASVLHHTSVVKEGDIYKTTIFVDLTDLKSTTTLLDIIGEIGPDIAVNGDWAADSGWTYGADWSFSSNKADCAPGAGTVMEPAAKLIVVAGYTYELAFTMSSYSAGACVASIGGTNFTSRGSDATFTERVVAADTTNLKFTGNAAGDFQIDDVVLKLVSPAHIGQITAAVNGTLFRGTITCLETPATGVTDIDLYSSAAADLLDLLYDEDGSAGTETVLRANAGAWSADINAKIDLTALPAADEYMFFVNGASGTVGTYSAGQFLIELWGA
jgi:hypothetical protein